MNPQDRIDRKKHEVDIAERVLEGGVWNTVPPSERGHIIGTEIGLQILPVGEEVSVTQVHPQDPKPDDR